MKLANGFTHAATRTSRGHMLRIVCSAGSCRLIAQQSYSSLRRSIKRWCVSGLSYSAASACIFP